jgi:hypothetical protein
LGRVGPSPSESSTYGSPYITSIKASKLRIAPQVASAISSYVRVKIYNILNGPLKGKIAYTDTDSIFATEPLQESYISDLELGKWKYEGKFDIGIFIAKKLYNLLNSSKDINQEKNNLNNISSVNLSENLLVANRDSMIVANLTEETFKDEETISNLNSQDFTLTQILEQMKINDFSDLDSIKYAAKGIPPNYYSQIKQEDWVNMLNKQPFTKLLEGNVTNNAIRMERDFITGLITVLAPNINISNSSIDNSRLRIFDKNNKWVNTKPLIVNENTKISLVDYRIIRRDIEKQIKEYKKTNSKSAKNKMNFIFIKR